MNFTQLIITSIKQNGYISVILGGLIEQVIVPIPSPIIPMAAGFFFVPQNIQSFGLLMRNIFFKAALPFAIGSTIGSTIIYIASWFGGKYLINKFSRWLEIRWEDVEIIKEKYFKGNFWDEVVIFVSRAIPVIPSVLFSAACGALRIKPVSYYLFSALGLIVRGMLLGWIGWQSGEALFAVSEGIDRWEMIVSIALVIVSGAVLLFAYFKREKWLENLRKNA